MRPKKNLCPSWPSDFYSVLSPLYSKFIITLRHIQSTGQDMKSTTGSFSHPVSQWLSFTPTPPFRLPPCPSADSYKEQWLESPSMKWDGPSRPSYCISCCRWCLCEHTWLDTSNTPSSAVVIPLALLWQSWYYYNAVCHLSDKDGKAWILTVCSQLLSINRVIT